MAVPAEDLRSWIVAGARSGLQAAVSPCTVTDSPDGPVLGPRNGPGRKLDFPALAFPPERLGSEPGGDFLVLLDEPDAVYAVAEIVATTGTSAGVSLGRAGDKCVLLLQGAGWRVAAGAPTSAWRVDARRRTGVRWGWAHPLQGSFPSPADPAAWLLVDEAGRASTLKVEGLTPCESRRAAWTVAGDVGPASVWSAVPDKVVVRPHKSSKSGTADDPEVWLLDAADTGRLADLLGLLPEEHLGSLHVGEFLDGAATLLLVRESARGRHRPRILPWSDRTYATWPGVLGGLTKTGLRFAPALPATAWNSRVAPRTGGTPAVVDLTADGKLAVGVVGGQLASAAEVTTYVTGAQARLAEIRADDPWVVRPLHGDGVTVPRREAPAAPAPRPEVQQQTRGEPEPEQTRRPARPKAPEVHEERQRPAEVIPQRREAPVRDDAETRRLEDHLVAHPTDAQSWLALAEVRSTAGLYDESAAALEAAWWSSSGDEAARIAQRLADVGRYLGAGSAAFAATLSLAVEARGLQASTFAARHETVTSRVQDGLKFMRRRGQWICLRTLASAAGDDLELERAREECLAGLAVRGVEDRDVPSFVRRRLSELHSTARDAGGRSAVSKFLAALETFAGSLGGGPSCSTFYADAAWAHADIGSPKKAEELGARAVAAVGNDDTSEAAVSALCRVGAVRERTGSGGADLVATALARVAKALAAAGTGAESQATKESSARKSLVRWFRVTAECPRSPVIDAHVAAAVKLLEGAGPRFRAQAIFGAWEAMVSLGLSSKVTEVGRSVISRDDKDLKFMFVEDATSAIAKVGGGKLDLADARRVIDLCRKYPREVTEFTPQLLEPAFAAQRDPWESARALHDEFERGGHQFQARVALLSGIRALATVGDRERGMRAVEEFLPAVLRWTGTDLGKHRMRLVVRLVAELPKFGMRGRGMAMVNVAREGAFADADLVIRSEILNKCITAASQLGMPEEAARFLSESVEHLCALVESTGSVPAYLFESLKHAAEGAEKIGEAGLPVVRRVAGIVRAHVARIDDATARRTDAIRNAFHLYRTLVACAASALRLGDAALATESIDVALSRLDTLSQAKDRVDVVIHAVPVVADLDVQARVDLACRILTHLQPVVIGGTTWAKEKAQEVAERVANEVVRGESAFLSAMARWRGDEEARIRARIASDGLADLGTFGRGS